MRARARGPGAGPRAARAGPRTGDWVRTPTTPPRPPARRGGTAGAVSTTGTGRGRGGRAWTRHGHRPAGQGARPPCRAPAAVPSWWEEAASWPEEDKRSGGAGAGRRGSGGERWPADGGLGGGEEGTSSSSRPGPPGDDDSAGGGPEARDGGGLDASWPPNGGLDPAYEADAPADGGGLADLPPVPRGFFAAPEVEGEDAAGVVGGVGAEYGEGFTTWAPGGELRVDVDYLNERLEVKGAMRLRHNQIAPDEALGLIFDWDGTLGNTRDAQRRAWKRLAEEKGLWWPDIERPAMYEMRPERAIIDMLQWTRDFGEAQKLGYEVAMLFREESARLVEGRGGPAPGIRAWIDAVHTFNVPCAFVTSLDRGTVEPLLREYGLLEKFDACVFSEDGMETLAHQLLSASVKLGRPPKRCVAFTGEPPMVTAAHNCTMRAVGIVGNYSQYDLGQADLTCRDLGELSIISMRNLFANEGTQFMDVQTELDELPQSQVQTSLEMLEK